MLIYYGELKRPHGQAVKTAPSHGAIRGSSPLGVTTDLLLIGREIFFINGVLWTITDI